MEPLEDRTLLSVTLGFRLGAGPNVLAAVPNVLAAAHGPLVPGGETASVATQLVMHLPKHVPNGVPAPVELAALDAQNHRVLDYSGTVTLTSTDPDAVMPTSITFKNGRAVVPVTFLTTGTQSLTATDNSATPLTVTASADVAAPRVATQIFMRFLENTTSGHAVHVLLRALDADSQLVPTFSDTVKLTSTDPNIIVPESVTFDHGIATFEVTFNTVGQQSLTATTTNTSFTVAANTTVAAAPVATALVFRVPDEVTTGKAFTAKLGAVDSNRHLVPDFTGTVTVTSSDPDADLPTTVTFDHGVAVFQVTLNTVGPQTLTATTNSGTPLSATTNTTVATPAVATQLVMHVRQTSISGRPVLVELAAFDANGRPVSDFSGVIVLTSSDPNIVLPPTVAFRHGIAVFRVTFGTLGVQSLVATDNSASPLSMTVNTTVIAPPHSGNRTAHSNKR
jgi:DNA gyrase inhibitor GyrI